MAGAIGLADSVLVADAEFLEMFYDRGIAQGEDVVKLCQNS
jgi:hypothetical protein